MNEFILGQTYEFEVLDMIEYGVGARKLQLKYGDRTTYRCAPYPFQVENLPQVVYCKVIKLDLFNQLPTLVQDRTKLLKENYNIGEDAAFRIVDILTDPKSDAKYYQLEDRFGLTHRCYIRKGEEPQYVMGDVKSFEIKDIDEERSFLNLSTISYEKQVPVTIIKPKTFNASANSVFGVESRTLENKTSIVFTPGNHQANIDEQLPKIVQVIASFINTDGGQLNIGVNDYGMPVGMSEDYKHLNDGDDKYNGTYKADTDHYRLKILNAVKRYLGTRAATALTFDFPEEYNGTVCCIKVEKLKRPVFFAKYYLYTRLDGAMSRLSGDQITSYLRERTIADLREIIDPDTLGDIKIEPTITLEQIEALFIKHISNQPVVIPPAISPNVTVPTASLPTSTNNKEEVWNHFTYYTTGEYSIQKDPSTDSDVLLNLCVYKSQKNQRIVLCYENGYVASVEPADIYDSKYRGKRRKNGWNTKDKLVSAFATYNYDILAAVSCNQHRIQHIKAHTVGDLGETVQNMASKGNMFINPALGTVQRYIFVPNLYRNTIPNLILQKVETSTSLGIPVTSQDYLNEIHFLLNLK